MDTSPSPGPFTLKHLISVEGVSQFTFSGVVVDSLEEIPPGTLAGTPIFLRS